MADKGMGFSFLEYCNSNLSNTNEYNIARVLLKHIHELDAYSLDDISEEANISTASVSRLIKKMGFASYQEFRNDLIAFKHDVMIAREVTCTRRFFTKTNHQIVENLYDDAMNNLQQTMLGINMDQLDKIVKMLKESKSVTFVGDEHALSIFYMLQIDLVINDIPAYLFKQKDVMQAHSSFLEEGTTVVFLDVFNRFLGKHKRAILKEIREKQVKTIAFVQEETREYQDFDLVYQYGIEGSSNDGYYSLFLMNNIITSLLYKR